jgi:hypothetical protein
MLLMRGCACISGFALVFMRLSRNQSLFGNTATPHFISQGEVEVTVAGRQIKLGVGEVFGAFDSVPGGERRRSLVVALGKTPKRAY